MMNKSLWPIFNSQEWEYVGVRYPWYKFIRRGESQDDFASIQFVSCAQYIEFSDDGIVSTCMICDPLLPGLRDYRNYLN
jgi:hypothetical protein